MKFDAYDSNLNNCYHDHIKESWRIYSVDGNVFNYFMGPITAELEKTENLPIVDIRLLDENYGSLEDENGTLDEQIKNIKISTATGSMCSRNDGSGKVYLVSSAIRAALGSYFGSNGYCGMQLHQFLNTVFAGRYTLAELEEERTRLYEEFDRAHCVRDLIKYYIYNCDVLVLIDHGEQLK